MKQTKSKMIDLDLRGFKGTAETLLELFKHVAKKENWSEEKINTVLIEANKHDDYDHLVETIRAYCKH